MLVFLAELVDAATHVAHDLQPESLCLVAFAMVLARQGDEALGETDEPDAERPLIDHRLYGVVGAQAVAVVPESAHHERELLGEGRPLKVKAFVEL